MPRLSALRRKLRVTHRLANTSSWRSVKGKLAIIPPRPGHNRKVMGCHHFAVALLPARLLPGKRLQKSKSEGGNSMRIAANGSGMTSGARRFFACSASLAALTMASAPAWADDTAAKADAAPTADDAPAPADAAGDAAPADTAASAQSDKEITVTGSRILTTGMTAPVPVTAVKAEEIETMSPGVADHGVSQLPQFYSNQTPNSSQLLHPRSGYGSLNLRGLGVNRTLTLLNGRRFPSSSAFGGVDINLFPEAMIKSVETVTGGASAAYGTDAVAGVVNFILDTKFTGLQVNVEGGVTSRDDAQNWKGARSPTAPASPAAAGTCCVGRSHQPGWHLQLPQARLVPVGGHVRQLQRGRSLLLRAQCPLGQRQLRRHHLRARHGDQWPTVRQQRQRSSLPAGVDPARAPSALRGRAPSAAAPTTSAAKSPALARSQPLFAVRLCRLRPDR